MKNCSASQLTRKTTADFSVEKYISKIEQAQRNMICEILHGMQRPMLYSEIRNIIQPENKKISLVRDRYKMVRTRCEELQQQGVVVISQPNEVVCNHGDMVVSLVPELKKDT